MKKLNFVIEIEVPDGFDNIEGLILYINGSLDNLPIPEIIDKSLKDVCIGITYFDENKKLREEEEGWMK